MNAPNDDNLPEFVWTFNDEDEVSEVKRGWSAGKVERVAALAFALAFPLVMGGLFIVLIYLLFYTQTV